MKNIVRYIKESYEELVVNNLKVVYDVLPEEIYLTAPASYSESDIQIYLGDSFLSELPSENEKYSKAFGKNKKFINDAYFEYDKFEHINKDIKDVDVDIEWDSSYDERTNNDELNLFKITNLKYIILFDQFVLMDDKDNIENIINKIFNNLNSNDLNKYPLEIKYNSELTEYDE